MVVRRQTALDTMGQGITWPGGIFVGLAALGFPGELAGQAQVSSTLESAVLSR
jgi:hypothetical protein